jgi:acyl carrier protein
MGVDRNELKRLLAETCAIDRAAVRDDARLIEYGLDSVRALDYIISLEEAFGISIPDEAAAKLRTIAEVAAYIDERKGAAP